MYVCGREPNDPGGAKVTPLGSRLRALRARRGQRLKDMAAAIGVSSAYLSALEHGHRGTPTWALLQRIITHFNIIWDEAGELERLARLSNPNLTINTAGMTPQATELVNLLGERIGTLGVKEIEKVKAALLARGGES